MSLPNEYQVGVAACLDAIVQAFQDGGAIIDKIKRKRAMKRAPPPPRLLEESIDQAPAEIEREKQRGLDRYGKAFEDGDIMAIISLQQICIQLQSSFLVKLRNTAFDDDQKTTDFTCLVDAVDLGRDRTIAALCEFKTRLSQAEQDRPGEEQNHARQLHPVVSNTSPHSSASNITIPSSEPMQRSHTQRSAHSSHSQKEEQQQQSKARTWTRNFGQARDASGEEDTASGADDVNSHASAHAHHKKRTSILHFLKHSRTYSSEAKDKDRSSDLSRAPITEETKRGTEPVGMPARAPTQRDPSSPDATQPSQSSKFRYDDWEDDSSEIWGTGKPSLERRETVALAPDQASTVSTVDTRTSNHALGPPSPVLTNRTNSTSYNPREQLQHMTSTAIPTPNPENEFLGFCKGAWKLQNGDRKGSMAKCNEVNPWSRHQPITSNQYLSCQQPRCAFRSSFTHQDPNMIWNRVFTVEAKGVKVRWIFLAKSHISQKVVVKHQYSFRCLFCIFTRGKSDVHHGMDAYLDHINGEHRAQSLGDVILYKTGCIQGRVAADADEFDINLWPVGGDSREQADRKQSQWMADDPTTREQEFPFGGSHGEGKSDSMFSDEPWNEGLSDFRYGGEFESFEV